MVHPIRLADQFNIARLCYHIGKMGHRISGLNSGDEFFVPCIFRSCRNISTHEEAWIGRNSLCSQSANRKAEWSFALCIPCRRVQPDSLQRPWAIADHYGVKAADIGESHATTIDYLVA